jgi:hypothetical protein
MSGIYRGVRTRIAELVRHSILVRVHPRTHTKVLFNAHAQVYARVHAPVLGRVFNQGWFVTWGRINFRSFPHPWEKTNQ